jgi:hypothetical protein
VTAEAAPSPTAHETVAVRASVTLDDARTRAKTQQLAHWVLRQQTRPPLGDTIARAREDSPHEVLLALESRLRSDPAAAPELIQALAREQDPDVAFQMARALGPWLNDAGLRQATLVALAGQPSLLRAASLVALLGRAQPEVTAFLLEQLEDGSDPVVRARSSALLARAWPQLPPAVVERASATAREILSAPSSDAQEVSGAAELLGRPGARSTDMDLLWARLEATQDPTALSALVYGLCLGGSDLVTLRRELERLERRQGPLREHVARLRVALSG